MKKTRHIPSGKITSRRRFIGSTMALTGLAIIPSWISGDETGIIQTVRKPKKEITRQYKIGVCDWMLLKRQKAGAFKLAGEIDADGLEVDMGGLGNRTTFDNKLLDPVERRKFLEESKRYDIKICSLAMSGFYAQSFAERETVPIMVRDTINTMVMMQVRVAFLPLGVKGDLVQHPELRPIIVERLKMAGRMAEAADVTIGIETALDATGEVQLLQDIDSPAVKSYFNFANALQNSRDLCKELKTLGKDRICQIHCTDEDGVWLENNTRINMPEAKKTLDDMGWSGWLVIERSRDARNPHDIRGNFGANVKYLKSIFQS